MTFSLHQGGVVMSADNTHNHLTQSKWTKGSKLTKIIGTYKS